MARDMTPQQKLRYLRQHWPEAAAIGLRFIRAQGHDITITCCTDKFEQCERMKEYYRKRKEMQNVADQ